MERTWLQVDQQAGPNNQRLLTPPWSWNVQPLFPQWEPFQGQNLEKAMYCWDHLDRIHHWKLFKPPYKRLSSWWAGDGDGRVGVGGAVGRVGRRGVSYYLSCSTWQEPPKIPCLLKLPPTSQKSLLSLSLPSMLGVAAISNVTEGNPKSVNQKVGLGFGVLFFTQD